MKILLLGKTGQVGWELQRSLDPLGEIIAPATHGEALCGDLENLDGLRETLRITRPDVIVNAAAFTAVDEAETSPEKARVINADAVRLLARESAGALLVHYSTDYIFDGTGTKPWREDDPAGPLNVYGQTKWEGEQAIRESGARHLIFRVSWVYSARRKNFLRTILRLAAERETLRVINDQTGAPTSAALIADVTAHALRAVEKTASLTGTYHLAAAGETTWHEYAQFILNTARQAGWPLRTARIDAVTTSEFPTPARRPLNSRLDTTLLRETFSVHPPDWKTGIRRTLEELAPEFRS